MMKKILIVNNNMEVGGVQKSLSDLLWAIHDKYDVTLCLFAPEGAYMVQLPPNIRILCPKGPFRYLGRHQSLWRGADRLLRGGYALLAKTFGRQAAMKVMLLLEKPLPGEYDCAISFLHNGNIKNFYGGTQEFVLRKVHARKKVAFLHCDYGSNGADHPVNNRLLETFDAIAACSDGCREAFLKVLPDLDSRCVTVRNAHRYGAIREMAKKDPVTYPEGDCNLLMVSRLSKEKGIQRAMDAVAPMILQGMPVRLHIVGGGNLLQSLQQHATQLGIRDRVHFYGEQENPYRYMANADLLLMTSYHEAAPMVLEEAWCLGLPMLTMRTTSSKEMVTDRGCGWVCENEEDAFRLALEDILIHKKYLLCREAMAKQTMDNTEMMDQFDRLIRE